MSAWRDPKYCIWSALTLPQINTGIHLAKWIAPSVSQHSRTTKRVCIVDTSENVLAKYSHICNVACVEETVHDLRAVEVGADVDDIGCGTAPDHGVHDSGWIETTGDGFCGHTDEGGLGEGDYLGGTAVHFCHDAAELGLVAVLELLLTLADR